MITYHTVQPYIIWYIKIKVLSNILKILVRITSSTNFHSQPYQGKAFFCFSNFKRNKNLSIFIRIRIILKILTFVGVLGHPQNTEASFNFSLPKAHGENTASWIRWFLFYISSARWDIFPDVNICKSMHRVHCAPDEKRIHQTPLELPTNDKSEFDKYTQVSPKNSIKNLSLIVKARHHLIRCLQLAQ